LSATTLERQVAYADRDPVAGLQLRVADAAPVDLHAVGGAEVDGRPAALAAAQLDVAARHVRIVDHDVALAAAPDHDALAAQDVAPALGDQQRLAAVGDRVELARGAVGRVDHRVAEVARRRAGLGRLPLALRLAEQLGLDAKLPHGQPLVCVELDLRPARQRERLLARVLEQVVGQLLAQRGLVARELLAVARRQEHPVVVGHVHARDGDHLVLLHLLGELVGQLHRLHAGAEGAAERAFDDASELCLQIA
jgi:hypothetical protein